MYRLAEQRASIRWWRSAGVERELAAGQPFMNMCDGPSSLL
jgi:hypothetical protein